MTFIKGMDVSTLLEEEACGARYYDDGREMPLFDIMQKYKVNSVRLRLWNHPYDESGKPYGAGTNDLEKTKILAHRAKEAKMTWNLDFHYSDFWADPGKQYPPKAWEGHSADELVEDVYHFTKETCLSLKEENIEPSIVQVGNELTNGMMWPYGNRDYNRPENFTGNYFNPYLAKMVSAGITALREVLPETKVMIHLDNGGNNELYRNWFDGYLACKGIDFDCIGLSYYPFWHGNIKMLSDNLNDLANRYHKPLIIDEVSMGFTMQDYASYEKLGPDERKGYATKEKLLANLDYPMTIEGQKQFMEKIVEVLKEVPFGLGQGYYYWEPAWIPVPGCGWATKESLQYIKEPGPCGNEWANQALFDYDGNVLPAMKI